MVSRRHTRPPTDRDRLFETTFSAAVRPKSRWQFEALAELHERTQNEAHQDGTVDSELWKLVREVLLALKQLRTAMRKLSKLRRRELSQD